MDILRFITAGNVDDGKSTLIGRLLYDTGNIKADVLQNVAGDGNDDINLAHITDGLRAERQQGITIDVAYKYFTTPQRKYIITDAPGHFQYTRNLVTGASGTDAIIILIDAINGITLQTRRHSQVAAFLCITQIAVAVNKMDAVGYSQHVYNGIVQEFLQLASQLGLPAPVFIPMSALLGDNVSVPSANIDWYSGPTLLQYLEHCTAAASGPTGSDARFVVQYVMDGGSPLLAGRLHSGQLHTGDVVTLWPGQHSATVSRIIKGYEEVSLADSGADISVSLNAGIAVRGQALTTGAAPLYGKEWLADICWLSDAAPLKAGNQYLLHLNGQETLCTITSVVFKTDPATFGRTYDDDAAVEVNEFARIKLLTDVAITCELHSILPAWGRGVLIDKDTFYTCAALLIC